MSDNQSKKTAYCPYHYQSRKSNNPPDCANLLITLRNIQNMAYSFARDASQAIHKEEQEKHNYEQCASIALGGLNYLNIVRENAVSMLLDMQSHCFSLPQRRPVKISVRKYSRSRHGLS